jgi:hypothetical protein
MGALTHRWDTLARAAREIESRSDCYLRAPPRGIRRQSGLGKREGEDDDDEDALSRVHDNPHPRALEPPRGKGEEDRIGY